MKTKCTCKSLQQDKLHGDGIRVWNPTQKGRRCTVCGTEHISSGKK